MGRRESFSLPAAPSAFAIVRGSSQKRPIGLLSGVSLHRCTLVLPSFSHLATSSARPRHHSGVSKMISQLYFLPSGRVVLPTAQNSLPSGRTQANKSSFHSLSCFHISNFPP